MPPEDLRTLLTARPFMPFRIRLDDGQTFEVRDPDWLWVGRRVAVVGVFDREHFLERHITLSLVHITTVEPLTQPSQQAG